MAQEGAFQCAICGNGTNKIVFKDSKNQSKFPKDVHSMCMACYTSMEVAVNQSTNLKKSSMDGNFKPHFDGQLNKFFQSADEKRKHLASKGMVQLKGMPVSGDCRGSPHCTHGQYEAAKKKGLI